MYDVVNKILELPKLYQESENAFWDDDYISRQMLKAHLDPESDGASRKLDFIERSVAWIKEIAPPRHYHFLLDVGCGPGLYAERFTKRGYAVTGVDFSKRSISYAQNSAEKYSLDIKYYFQNYLALNVEEAFDLITMIYCDYGALSTENRRILLHNLYECLNTGGKLLLDVFSMAEYNGYENGKPGKRIKAAAFGAKKNTPC